MSISKLQDAAASHAAIAVTVPNTRMISATRRGATTRATPITNKVETIATTAPISDESITSRSNSTCATLNASVATAEPLPNTIPNRQSARRRRVRAT